MLRVAFTTLGCKVNQSETDLYTRQFAAAGHAVVSSEEPADVYVVNTCTVTHVADRKSRQVLNQAKRLSPNALVVATGCYASIVGQALSDERTLVVRNRDKDRVVALVEERLRADGVVPSDAWLEVPSYLDVEKYVAVSAGMKPGNGLSTRRRPMVKAQDGCDSHCTYCIIPRSRGRSRSVPPESVVQRVQALADDGHVEVVITGVDLGSYGEDADRLPDLGGLLSQILEKTDVRRIRVSSVEPGDFKQKWLELWSNPRLCRHLHVPLQSGSLGVLERMERKYSPEDFRDMIVACREAIPNVTVTTDVIVGFPGEADEEFAEGLDFIRAICFDGMHVFKYSQRSGTRAAKMADQVPEEVKQERSRLLREEAAAGVERLRERHCGQVMEVVWEEKDAAFRRGITDTNVRVYTPERPTGPLSKSRLVTKFRDGVRGETLSSTISLAPV